MHARDKRHKYSITNKMKKYIYISIKFPTYYSTNKRVGLALLADYLKNTKPILNLVVIFKKKLWHLQLK